VVDRPDAGDAGTRREGGRGGADRGAGGTGGSSLDDASANDDFPVFHEDACPDVNVAPPDLECDPLVQSTCSFGFACYPIPPRASDPCHPGRYSAICLPAGRG